MKQLNYQILLLPDNEKYPVKAPTLAHVENVVTKWVELGIVRVDQVAVYSRDVKTKTRIGFVYDPENKKAKALAKRVEQAIKGQQ